MNCLPNAPEPINYDFNYTTLDFFNYTIYDNGTVSNFSNCYLTFGEFHPVIESNGTVFNTTACDYPYYGPHARAGVGVAFAVLSLVLLPYTMFNLRRLGKQHSITEYKRFRVVGRRWQWYWLIIVHALAAVAGFLSIDIDRAYLQGSSLTGYGAVFTAMLPVCFGVTWEMTRHWGSFEERRLFEADPFMFRYDDCRSKVHLIMPLVFYMFGFFLFLLTVLRNWTNLIRINANFNTDTRWKVGVFLGVIAYFVIALQVYVTFRFYHPAKIQARIPLVYIGLGVFLAYNIAFAFDSSLSPFNPNSPVAAVAVWGYVPVLYIILVMNITGHRLMNEDKFIMQESREREAKNMTIVMQTVVVEESKHQLAGSSSSSASASQGEASNSTPARGYTVAEIKAFTKANKAARSSTRPEDRVRTIDASTSFADPPPTYPCSCASSG
ncbi:hypothetical protein V1514DRAFT_278482 [Lipomyces japonicus]|uniref:uncharacterized protein n=1 Tax=Lipomyces japonicus TaxID=56871 RepID=UPI0034D000D3